LSEVASLSDRVTIMRDGRTIGSVSGDDISFARLAEAIAADVAAEAA
jgi:ABC-type sugar transport system ATPase subunit